MTDEVTMGDSAVQGISQRLSSAADGLDGLSGSAPPAVDAGPVSGLVNAMLGVLTGAAASVVQGLGAGSEAVLDARRGLGVSDDAAAGTFGPAVGTSPFEGRP